MIRGRGLVTRLRVKSVKKRRTWFLQSYIGGVSATNVKTCIHQIVRYNINGFYD